MNASIGVVAPTLYSQSASHAAMQANCPTSSNQSCADQLGGRLQDFSLARDLSKMMSRGDVCGLDWPDFSAGVWSSDRPVIFREIILEPPFRIGRPAIIYCRAV